MCDFNFREYYLKLIKEEEKKEFRRLVMEKTGISYPGFNAWKFPGRNVPKRKLQVVMDIINDPSNDFPPVQNIELQTA